jgi:hypothetical protein
MTHKSQGFLDNAEISELLARRADNADGHLRRALRRASRLAFLWEEEAADVFRSGRELSELAGIGPYLARQLRAWLHRPPRVSRPPAIRQHFLTLAAARRLLAKQHEWRAARKGDLQMHSSWSDGSGTVDEMAKAADERGYQCRLEFGCY